MKYCNTNLRVFWMRSNKVKTGTQAVNKKVKDIDNGLSTAYNK